MKRSRLVFFITPLIFLGAGCVTSGKAAIIAQKDPIALVSVVSNEDVNWQGEAPASMDSFGSVIRRRLNADPDLAVITKADEFIDSAESIFRDSMTASRFINLADKDTVFRSRAYRDAVERKYKNRDVVKPGDYRFIDYKDKNFHSALAAETGLQRCMYVEFKFTKFVYSGISMIGTIKADVEMTVIILDAWGKTIYRKTVSATSASATKVSNDIYSRSEFLELFREAIDEVCFVFLDLFDN